MKSSHPRNPGIQHLPKTESVSERERMFPRPCHHASKCQVTKHSFEVKQDHAETLS